MLDTQCGVSDVTSWENTEKTDNTKSPRDIEPTWSIATQYTLMVGIPTVCVHSLFFFRMSWVLDGRVKSKKCSSRKKLVTVEKFWNAIISRSWLWALGIRFHIQNYITDSRNETKPPAAERHQKNKRKDNRIGARKSLWLKQDIVYVLWTVFPLSERFK